MIGPRARARAGPRVGPAVGVAADELGVLVDIDASGKYTPSTAAQWSALGITAPSSLWLCQDASGNLADAIGGKTLTTTGTPTYRKAVTGWSRYAIGASGAAENQYGSNGSMTDISTTSAMFLVYALIAAPAAGHQRVFHGAASANAFEGVAGGTLIRLRTGGASGNGAEAHGGQVRPYVVVYDVTNSVNIIYSDIEKRAITFGASSGAMFRLTFGVAADTTADTQVLLAASWNGAAAEFGDATATDAAVKAMLQRLNWAVSGY